MKVFSTLILLFVSSFAISFKSLGAPQRLPTPRVEARANPERAERPTFVFVHGGLSTGSVWRFVQAALEQSGYTTATLDLPGRSDDTTDPKAIDIVVATEKACEELARHNNSVVLVGHSQGGGPITLATEICGGNIMALVYITAVVPLPGETALSSLNPRRDNTIPGCTYLDANAGLFRVNPQGPLEQAFFHDLRAVNPELADSFVSELVPEPIGIGTTKLSYDEERFRRVPKIYIETLDDKILSLETQRMYQKRFAFAKVYSLKSSHMPLLSQPKAVAEALIDSLLTIWK